MDEATLAIVDAFWAAYYGIEPERLSASGVVVVSHAGLAGYHGLQGFERGEVLVISVPPELEEDARATLSGWRLERLADPGAVAGALSVEIAEAVGPAVLAYADRRSFRPEPSLWVRRLSTADREALETLRASCRLNEWEHGGADLAADVLEMPCAGWFEEGELLSLAHYVVWGGALAQIRVVTATGARGRRRGCGVVSAVTGLALAEGLVPQFRTLASNRPALALARALGYLPYARTVSVRFAEGPRPGQR